MNKVDINMSHKIITSASQLTSAALMKWYILMEVKTDTAGVRKASEIRLHNFSQGALDKCTDSPNSPWFIPYSPSTLLKYIIPEILSKLIYIFLFRFTFYSGELKNH